MITKTLGGLSPAEFDDLIDDFIEREDPVAISLDVLAELDSENSPPTSAEQVAFEFLGRVVGKELELFSLAESSILEVKDNEIHLPNGWRVVLQLEPPLSVASNPSELSRPSRGKPQRQRN